MLCTEKHPAVNSSMQVIPLVIFRPVMRLRRITVVVVVVVIRAAAEEEEVVWTGLAIRDIPILDTDRSNPAIFEKLSKKPGKWLWV